MQLPNSICNKTITKPWSSLVEEMKVRIGPTVKQVQVGPCADCIYFWIENKQQLSAWTDANLPSSLTTKELHDLALWLKRCRGVGQVCDCCTTFAKRISAAQWLCNHPWVVQSNIRFIRVTPVLFAKVSTFYLFCTHSMYECTFSWGPMLLNFVWINSWACNTLESRRRFRRS